MAMVIPTPEQLKEAVQRHLQAHLEGFDPEQLDSAGRDALNAIHLEILHTMNKHSRRLNAILTGQSIYEADHINRLPTELLVQIIQGAMLKTRKGEIVGPKKDIPKYVGNIINIGLVCKRWKEIVDALPNLWSFISVYANPGYNAKALSSGVPLIIDCDVTSELVDEDIKTDDSSIAKFAESLKPHLNRWNTAVLSLEDRDVEAFRACLQSSDCSVRELTLKIGWDNESEPAAFNLLGGKAGQMKKLELERVPVYWDSPAVSGLEHLSITGIQDVDDAPSLTELLGILRGCPQLQTLKLDELNVDYEDAEAEIVNLSSIKTIDIDKLPLTATEILFRHLRLGPECEYLGLTLDYERWDFGNEAHFDVTSLDSHIPLIRRNLEGCLTAGRYPELTMGTGGSVFLNARTRDTGNATGFEMELSEFEGVPPPNVLAWWNCLISDCNTECPIRLILNARGKNTDYLEGISNLDIAELVLNDIFSYKGAQHDLFRILTTPTTLEGSDTQVWLLHKARTIKLQVEELDQDAFIGMLRTRYAKDTMIEGISVLPATSLSAVDLGEYVPSQPMLEELRSMFGAGIRLLWQSPKAFPGMIANEPPQIL